MAVQRDAVVQPALVDLGLEHRAVVAVAGDLQRALRDALQHVEQDLEPLVLLDAARGRAAWASASVGRVEERVGLDAEVGDVDVLGRDARASTMSRRAESEIVRNGPWR